MSASGVFQRRNIKNTATSMPNSLFLLEDSIPSRIVLYHVVHKVLFENEVPCLTAISQPTKSEVVKGIDDAMVGIGAVACSLVVGSSTASGCFSFRAPRAGCALGLA